MQEEVIVKNSKKRKIDLETGYMYTKKSKYSPYMLIGIRVVEPYGLGYSITDEIYEFNEIFDGEYIKYKSYLPVQQFRYACSKFLIESKKYMVNKNGIADENLIVELISKYSDKSTKKR